VPQSAGPPPGRPVATVIVADPVGLAAIWTVAALTAASGLMVAVRMYETQQPDQPEQT